MARFAEIEEFVPYTGVQDEGRANPQRLQDALDAAETAAESYTGRSFSPDPPLVDGADTAPPVAKVRSVRGKSQVRVPDLRVATSVSIDGVALLENYGFSYDATEQPAQTLYLSSYRVAPGAMGLVTIVGRWGFLVTPPDVRQAMFRHAARLYHRVDNKMSDIQATPDGGAFVYNTAIPGDIQEVYDRYKNRRLAFA